MRKNVQVLIARLPEGKLRVEDYEVAESTVPEIGEGQVLVETQAFAITAGTRVGLQGSASYAGAPQVGDVMGSAAAVGRVVSSRNDGIPEGVNVSAATGWQQYSVHDGADVYVIPSDHDPIDHLGPLGINGLTAYFGLHEVGRPEPGDTFLVSAAAGSVGHLVGQMARIRKSRVVGVTGSEAKGKVLVDDLGFDAWVNHRDPDFRKTLKAATPNGVDVYFDNTGGTILGSALFRMNTGGRIACCGVVSQYDTDSPEPGPKGIPGLLVNKCITMQGFLVFQFESRYAEAREEIRGWLASGDLRCLTDEAHGLEAAPEAFVDILRGGNLGTRIVRLDG